ncbi:hypothetical protein [Kitasatospora azatica]|uniref:hypothetical protein n=1 Tax=Kitasatospora azatica TaxID=58347 RepID=UPI00055B1AD5|nr:hypothetical protein [Kitasatospora azatica]
MDDKTTATRPARRRLAAAALLLSVTAAVSACGGSSGTKTVASSANSAGASSSASAAASASASASGSASASPSGAASTGGSSDSASTPGAAGSSTPAGGGNPPATSAPLKPTTAPPAGATPPDNPNDAKANLKPLSYLTQNNQLTVFFFGGTCDKYGLKLNETKPGQVGVDVVITVPAKVGQMCPALVKRQSVTADLSQPLQGRTVINLRDGSDVPLESVPNGGPVSADN